MQAQGVLGQKVKDHSCPVLDPSGFLHHLLLTYTHVHDLANTHSNLLNCTVLCCTVTHRIKKKQAGLRTQTHTHTVSHTHTHTLKYTLPQAHRHALTGTRTQKHTHTICRACS